MATVITSERLRRMSSDEVIQWLSVEGVIEYGYLPESQVWEIRNPFVSGVRYLPRSRVIRSTPNEPGWYFFEGDILSDWAGLKDIKRTVVYVGRVNVTSKLSAINFAGYKSIALRWFLGEFSRIYPHWEEEPYVPVPDAVEVGDGESIIEF